MLSSVVVSLPISPFIVWVKRFSLSPSFETVFIVARLMLLFLCAGRFGFLYERFGIWIPFPGIWFAWISVINCYDGHPWYYSWSFAGLRLSASAFRDFNLTKGFVRLNPLLSFIVGPLILVLPLWLLSRWTTICWWFVRFSIMFRLGRCFDSVFLTFNCWGHALPLTRWPYGALSLVDAPTAHFVSDLWCLVQS